MKILTIILIRLIKIYKFFISPLLGNSCRFAPTCSDYSIEALKTYGFLKGLFLSFKRIISCNPWGGSGFDPVKKKMKIRK
jgi:putative membrane protein insertion efficiency factor|tara:strand:- start:489 stop:728 length:240 start_codon:yes stop_codon:yes gene_type:complete